jgi:type IV pilus assembly protein PilO
VKNRTLTIGALAAVLVIALWWFLVYSGLNSKAGDISDDISAAESEQTTLRGQLAELEAIEAQAPEIEAQLAELQQKLPANPDLASFLDITTQIERDSQVSFVSIAPGDPTQAGSVATVPLTIVVEGGYFEVLEYLRRIEELPRLVVVDGISLTAGGSQDGEAAAPTDAPSIQVTLTARMFSLSMESTTPTTVATTTTVAGSE